MQKRMSDLFQQELQTFDPTFRDLHFEILQLKLFRVRNSLLTQIELKCIPQSRLLTSIAKLWN